MKVVVSAAALADISGIVSYIAVEEQNLDAGEMVGASIADTIESLSEFPNRHPVSRLVADQYPGTRQAAVGPFLIFYRVAKDTVQVARVLHGARDIPSSYRNT